MSTAKEEVKKILDQIPDDASFEDIQYHIYVREKIKHGLKDIKEGRVLSQEEISLRELTPPLPNQQEEFAQDQPSSEGNLVIN